MNVQIREGSIEEIVKLSLQIPEFTQPYPESLYRQRLTAHPHLILIAELDGTPAAFKVGYGSALPGVFYSWVGGVLVPFRRLGLATRLADEQEACVASQGYYAIQFKTRNRFVNMLRFGLGRGFQIIHLEKKGDVADYRVLLEKLL